ncbi:MAG: hypothetical protein K6A63_05210 [Acholeplasmatales bacterium]|nr:hypothetical protein [Acholeplasmatales bacterium]
MPKVKLSDLIKEYEENEVIINKPTFSVKDEFERLKAIYRKNSIKMNIINGIDEVYGAQKTLELIKLVFAKLHEQNAEFDEKTALAEMNERVNTRKAEAIFHDAFSPDDNNMPLKEEIKAECRNIGVTNSNSVSGYGYKNFYDHMVEKFGEPLTQYLNGKSKPQSYVSWNTLNVNIIDIAKDDALDIDLDKEVTKEYYAFDIHNPYLAKGKNKKPILDIIKNTDYYKNSNFDLSKELDEIDLIIEEPKPEVEFQLNQVRDNLEAETTALNKKAYGNKLEEDKEKNFDSVKFDNTNTTASTVLILKPEVNFKEYEDGIDIKINDKAKEGIILGVKKLKAMKAKAHYSEEGIKAYSFTNLLTIADKIINTTDEIVGINANIGQKEALKAAGNQNAQIDTDITNLKAELEAKTAELFELNKAYKEEDKHLEELREITVKYFGDNKFSNTNVDVTRTSTVPFKYRKDIITNGRMNGLAYWYAIIEESGMTPEEFMENPGKNFYEISKRKANIDENTLLKNDVKAEVNAGEMSLFDKYRKMLNYNDFADELKMKGDICDNMVRGMDFLISTDEEHFVENNIAYERMNNLMDKQFRFYKQHMLFASKALESYERLFMVDDVPLMDLLADDYFDPFKFEIVKAKPFDLDKYINEHEIKPMDILMKYETMVRAYMDKNKTINPSDPESVYESLSADIKVMTAALAEASAKYLEVNGIDPEKNTDPVVGLLIQSIEDPKKLVRDYIGFKHYTHSNINQKDLKIKLDRLKISKYLVYQA